MGEGALAAAGGEGAPWCEALLEVATNCTIEPTDPGLGCFRLNNYHHPYGRKRRRTKGALNERERGELETAGLKLNIQKTKIMASGPITSWQTDGETMETETAFIFLDSKITADGDCSHEIKRCWLLGRKTVTNLDSILKSRDIILLIKVHLVKAMVFPVVMYGCESWDYKES